MQLAFALLADYTTTSKEDKFSVLGIFDRIGARSFPARHAQLQFAMRLISSHDDIGQERTVLVELVDAEGKTLQSADGRLSLPNDITRPPTLNLVMIFENLQFPAAGLYQFNVVLDGKRVAEVPLTLELMAQH